MPHSTTKKNRRSILILGISLISFASLLAFPSFAWLIAPQTSSPIGSALTGKANGSYFNGGDGSADHPYEIDNALQLYYFNWLQDLGYFNKREGETSSGEEDTSTPIKQIYFKLTSDIDASSSCLPPAGTTQYPFVGNFNGDGHVIKGLTITNDESKLKRIPQDASFTNGLLDNAEIVGFFGIIGQYKDKLDYTIKNVAEDGTVTYVNEVSNLYFDDLNVDTAASKSLTGLIAGYVNGNLSYCGVRAGSLTYASSTGALDGYDQLSKYSLIGDYNTENFIWKGQPKNKGGSTWGDSVDIYSVSKRLGYIYGTITTPSGDGYLRLWTSDTYHINGGLSSTTVDTYDYKGETVSAMLLTDTYIPLSVSSDPTTYKAGGAETATDSNGGYIVGGGSSTYASSSYVRVRNLVESTTGTGAKDGDSYGLALGIMNSISAFPVSESTLSFLYYDSVNKKHYRIRDENNKDTAFAMKRAKSGDSYTNASIEADEQGKATSFAFNNYANVKSNLISTLNTVTSELGKSNAVVLPGMMLVNQTKTESYTATGGVKISGKSYTSYEFYKGGIDFTLKEDGYASMVLGTYTSSVNPPYFYKFYELDRNETGTTSAISNAKEIKRISGSFKNKNLAYEYADSTSETAFSENNLCFDFSSFSETVTSGNKTTVQGVLRNYAAYFVEIPLKKGSYFMAPGITSSSSNKSNMPYLLYFDIGENATGGEGTTTDSSPDIDFVYYEDEAATTKKILKIDDKSYVASGVYFSVGTSPTSVYYWRNSSGSGVFYCVLPSSASSAIVSVGTGSSVKKDQPYSTEETSGS